MIISTGLISQKEINKLIKNLLKIRKSNIAVLHCVACYPTDEKRCKYAIY